MKKTNKIILGLGTVALLTTGAYACKNFDSKKQCGVKQHKMSKKCGMKKSHDMHKGPKLLKTIKKLDLTKAQKDKIDTILEETRKNKINPYDAFTQSSFDKEKFVKLMKEKKETMAAKRAETIAKVYEVLTNEQKKNLKTLLDMQEIMHEKMMKKHKKGGNSNVKNCDGRG